MTKEITGRAKGGKKTASLLTAEEKKTKARKAAQTRWKQDKQTLKVTHGSSDHPLKIGDIEIPCYVLEDDTRVLSQRGLMGGLNISRGSAGDQLMAFATHKTILPYISNELMLALESPIKFKNPAGGGIVFGYPATVLPDICDAILSARKERALLKYQENIAMRCELLMRGFARVGIIALIDEATGYQHDRAKDALARILEAFIAKELQPYIPTFPTDFYQEMFRLRGLPFPTNAVKRPQYFGCLTNNIIYERLAPGVKEELQKGIPRNDAGRPKAKYFQKLTQNTGYPKLRELLGSVVTLMKLSNNWNDFMKKIDMIHPKIRETYEMKLEYKPEEDTGSGF